MQLTGMTVTLVVAVIGLFGALCVAWDTHRHDRQQQARLVLLEPAEQFARSALAALAALRYVTPPTAPAASVRLHRNEAILAAHAEREKRLTACRRDVDAVRYGRAHLRLVFHPCSSVADWSRLSLEAIRECLELAEIFYEDYDTCVAVGDDVNLWRNGSGNDTRKDYKDCRKLAYRTLDVLFRDVAWCLVKPELGSPARVAPLSENDTELRTRLVKFIADNKVRYNRKESDG